MYNLGKSDGTAIYQNVYWYGNCDISNLAVGDYNIYIVGFVIGSNNALDGGFLNYCNSPTFRAISGGSIVSDWTPSGTSSIKKYAINVSNATNKFTWTSNLKSGYPNIGIAILAFKK